MKKLPWHILFLAAFFPSFLYVNNMDQSTASEALPAIFASLLMSIVLCFVFTKFAKISLIKSGLLTSAFVSFFYSFGRIQGSLHGLLLKQDKDIVLPYFGPVPLLGLLVGICIIIVSLLLFVWLYKKFAHNQPRVEGLTQGLNLIAGILLLMQPVTYFSNLYSMHGHEAYKDKVFSPISFESEKAKAGDANLPDIYFIVPDGYARKDYLMNFYGHDNSPFIGDLQSRGFQVAEKSYANFYWTYLSLGSTLNMDYVNSYADILGRNNKDRSIPYYLVKNNRVLQYLKTLGYKYYQTSSTWGATLSNPWADKILRCSNGKLFDQEYYRVLVETTLLRPFISQVGTDLASCHLNSFKNLASIAKEASDAPRFVFSHFVPPHHPYLFDRDGNVLKFATVSNQFDFQARLWDKTGPYVEQLLFMNKKLLELIDDIQKSSKRPTIIVIASDHGTHLDGFIKEPVMWRRARLANFVAVYSSDPSYKLADPVSNVNLFRDIFRQHFGAKMEILPQRSYHSPYGRPYKFKEVSIPEFEAQAKP